MIIKIGANQYVNMDNIEAFHIVRKQFPKQDIFDPAKLNPDTNTLKVERGFSMEFVGVSGERHSGYVMKTSAAMVAWWKEINAGKVENE